MTKLSTGIDHHKRYSVACTLDEQGSLIKEGRINGHEPEAIASCFKALETSTAVVIEASWNWETIYDLLEGTPDVSEVVLSHPAKNRIIADAQIKKRPR